MSREELFRQITDKRSFLCVGLDTDIRKIPAHLRSAKNPLFEFNRAIVDATARYAVAFKPNLAFYEAHGPEGMAQFVETCRYIRANHPDIMIIADAKRGDIGNTARMYAGAFFDDDLADAVTVAPYMGADSVAPFLEREGKWAVVLALTSNPGAGDFETLPLANGKPLFRQVLETAAGWGTPDNMMFVAGATRGQMLADVRAAVPDHFLLVPGVGAQGGSLAEAALYGMNDRCGLLVNSSRAIIYADDTENFASAAAREAKSAADEMSALLDRYF